MEFSKFKAATVQTAPVFLNVENTVDKAISIILELDYDSGTRKQMVRKTL